MSGPTCTRREAARNEKRRERTANPKVSRSTSQYHPWPDKRMTSAGLELCAHDSSQGGSRAAPLRPIAGLEFREPRAGVAFEQLHNVGQRPRQCCRRAAVTRRHWGGSHLCHLAHGAATHVGGPAARLTQGRRHRRWSRPTAAHPYGRDMFAARCRCRATDGTPTHTGPSNAASTCRLVQHRVPESVSEVSPRTLRPLQHTGTDGFSRRGG